MKKNNLLITALILQICFSITTLAQESNFKEDYSAYLPEIRSVNNFILQDPQMKSMIAISTKDGLNNARKVMNSYATAKTILQPTQISIKGPGGNILLTIFKPDTIRAVVLDIHGGGFCLGTPANDAVFNDEMARTCNVAVVSVDYRLAPEFPFPSCIEDCKAAVKWLVNNAQKEFGTDKLFLSGNSAGGHLAAETALYVRDSLKAIERVKGVNLIYGVFDLGRTPSSRLATDSTIMLNKKGMEDNFQLVVGSWSLHKLQKPEYSPLYADLKGMPPALFTVGTADPLIDDSYFMETRWRNAGNKTFLAVYPVCSHAFNFFPTKIAKVANMQMYMWINELCK